MDLFGGLLQNPEFGRVFRGSAHFRALFSRHWEMSIDQDVVALRGKASIDVDPDGTLVLRSKDLSHTWRQSSDEAPLEFVQRVLFGRNTDPLDPTSNFGMSGLRTSEVIAGRQTHRGRLEMGAIAERNNVTLHYRTFNANIYGRIEDMIEKDASGEMKGLLLADTDKTRLLEMYDKSDGRKLSLPEILKTIGVDPKDQNFAKRVRAIFNATQGSVGYAPGEMNVHMLNIENLYSPGSLLYKRAEDLARQEKAFNPSVNIATRTREILSADIDGINFQSKAANDRMLAKMGREVADRKAYLEANRGLFSQTEMFEEERAIQAMQAELSTIRTRIKNGTAYNMRAYGQAAGIQDGIYVKGDIMTISDDEARTLVRRSAGQNLTDAEIDAMDLIVSESKSDIGILRGRAGRITIDPVSNVGQVYSDVLSTANFGDFYNPMMPSGMSLLEESLQETLSTERAKILGGDISSLRAIAAGMDDLHVNMFDDPQEYYDRIKNRQFIQRVEDFVMSGGRLESNPQMTQEALRIIQEKHFNQRRFGQTIDLAGEEVMDLKLRIPVPNSVKAHGVASGILSENPYMSAAKLADVRVSESVIANPGMSVIVPDFGGVNRFQFGAADITRYSAALGGPDYDDLFNAMYVYDPEARRTLALMSRSPNALTEYAYADVDLALSKEFRSSEITFGGKTMTVGQLNEMQKATNMRIEKIIKRNPRKGFRGAQEKKLIKLLNQRDEMNDAFHDYFSNQSGLRQIKLSEMYSMDRNTKMRRNYAPAGSRTTDEGIARYVAGSGMRGYGTTSGTAAQRIAATKAEYEMLRTGQSTLPFEYVGSHYNEIFQGRSGRLYANAYDVTNLRQIEAEAAAPGRVETATTLARNKAIIEAEGLLGKAVNTSTVIEDFIETSLKSGTLNAAQIDQFMSLVEGAGKITRIEREKVIDNIRKTGDPRYIQVINDVLQGNLYKLGQILGGMGELGLDPALLGQRLKSEETLREIARGYSNALGRSVGLDEMREAITLTSNDPRSRVGKLYEGVISQMNDFKETTEADIMSRTQNLLDDISESGFQASEQEIERARQFLQGFVEDSAQFTSALDDPNAIEELLEMALEQSQHTTDPAHILGEFTGEEVHRRSVARLDGWNLLDDRRALNRQLVAIRQMAAIRDLQAGRIIASRALDQTALSPAGSISRFAQEAIAEVVYDSPARSMLMRALETSMGSDMFDPDEFLGSVNEILGGANTKFSTPTARTIAVGELLERMQEVGYDVSGRIERLGSVADYDSSVWDSVDNPGMVHHAMRSGADQTAESVLDAIPQNALRRFNMAEMSKLLSTPGFRKGLGAAAIFAGLGLVHEIRGDRTYADVQGPLMMPDSVGYTGGPNTSPTLTFPGIGGDRFTQGTTYAVRGSGSFDPDSLNAQLNSVTGANSSGTIYPGRPLYGIPSGRSSSSDILNSYMSDY